MRIQLAKAVVVDWKQECGELAYHQFTEWCLMQKPPLIGMRLGWSGPTGGTQVFFAEHEERIRGYLKERGLEFAEYNEAGPVANTADPDVARSGIPCKCDSGFCPIHAE